MKNIDLLSWIGTIKDIELLEFFENLKNSNDSNNSNNYSDITPDLIDDFIKKHNL
ncbi:hypothetical protein ACUPZ6_001716 [Campylobacter coli]